MLFVCSFRMIIALASLTRDYFLSYRDAWGCWSGGFLATEHSDTTTRDESYEDTEPEILLFPDQYLRPEPVGLRIRTL